MTNRTFRAQRTAPRARSAGECGFSLVETLAVLALIGILVSLAAPRLDLASYQVTAGAREMGSHLLAIQRLAVKRQHDVVVAFDVDGRRMRIHEDADNDGSIDAGETVRFERLPKGVEFGVGSAPLPEELAIAAAVAFDGRQQSLPAVTFRRSGSASEQGGLLLTSGRASAGGGYAHHSRAVRVERSTGRVSWYRYGTSGWRREL